MTADDLPEAPTMRVRARLGAGARAEEARLDAIVADLAIEDGLRPDDQTRAAVIAALSQAVHDAAETIAAHAARLIPRGTVTTLAPPAAVYQRLFRAGTLFDRDLMRAALSEARTTLIDEALVATRAPDETPMLLPRLADHRDPLVRDSATRFLLADSRRRRGAARPPELGADATHRLAWLVAAALAQEAGETQSLIAPALIEATLRFLAGRDEDGHAAAAAVKLAAALDIPIDDRAGVFGEALAEGRTALFAALLAHATGLDMEAALAATLDPLPTALLVALRAAGVARDDLARIGLRLADADRARDAEALVDEVEAAAALSVAEAATAIGPLTLERDFRAAVRRLEQAPR